MYRPLFLLAALTVVATNVTAQSSQNEDLCYLVADNNGVRFDADMVTIVDKTSGLERELGQTGTLNIEAVAFHPFSPAIFAADGGLLGNIDATTGRFSPIGWLGTAYGDEGPLSAGDVDGMTFDPSTGELYGSVRRASGDFLVQIDPASGRVVADAFGAGADYIRVEFDGSGATVDDIAIDPISGDFFALVTDGDEISTLVTIDQTTGVATVRAQLAMRDLEGLSFDAAGRLYATPGGDGPNMVEINPSNGGLTLFAPIGVNRNRDYEALTCMAYGATSSSTEVAELPAHPALLPAYPNPFNPTTTLSFALPANSNVKLAVYDMLGREVETLAQGWWTAGTHELRFDAGNLPSGLYMYRLTGQGFVLTRTVTLLR